MTPMEPEFIDPPLPGRRSDQDEQWANTIAALIKRSGEWARIFIGDYKDAPLLAKRIRNSRGGWAGHEWEVTTRNTGKPSAIHVYARHIKALDNWSKETS